MIEYIWSKEIDKDTTENIEDSIKLQIIDVYLKDVHPLIVNLNLTNDIIEGSIIDEDKNLLKTFRLSGNKNIIITTVLEKDDSQ